MDDNGLADLLVGKKITEVAFVSDSIEVRFGDIVLTGYTEPFGMIACWGVGEKALRYLIGKRVDHVEVVPGRFLAIDSGENRLAFPIDEPSRNGPEAVRVYAPGAGGLDEPAKHWIW